MKTYQPKAKEIKRESHEIDAKGEILGRLATKIAGLLTGKGKPTYATHMDMGDSVTVLNAEKIVVTGKKAQQKVYQGHSGYPGGFKEETYAKVHKEHPERILEHAVSGMLPDNRLKAERLKRLTIVIGDKK
ncbi:MAG TPA: 50S ribosomal protein L13 [Patescibacteria group bacterium]|nr:50S ribosomal protein L13 [Patescibacteria group bacterium]